MNLIHSLHHSFLKNVKRDAFCINDAFYTYLDLLNLIAKIRESIVLNIDPSEKHIGLITNNDLNTYA